MAGTINKCIIFKEQKHDLRAYFDVSWANNKTVQNCTPGRVCMYNKGLISWYSCKQKLVAASSTESEYIALLPIAKESQ